MRYDEFGNETHEVGGFPVLDLNTPAGIAGSTIAMLMVMNAELETKLRVATSKLEERDRELMESRRFLIDRTQTFEKTLIAKKLEGERHLPLLDNIEETLTKFVAEAHGKKFRSKEVEPFIELARRAVFLLSQVDRYRRGFPLQFGWE